MDKNMNKNMITLNDGNQIPAVGFGVFMIENGGPAYDAVLAESGLPAHRHSRRLF